MSGTGPSRDDIDAAIGGDRMALVRVVRAAEHQAYRLAVRFFGETEAARDATQEVLIKVVTRLSTFEGESRFSTWVHTIAIRTFLDHRRSRTEEQLGSEAAFDAFLSVGLASPDASPDAAVLREEIALSCSTAMLTTLSRELRASYVLGAILELPGEDAAAILGIEPTTHRKRLQDARTRVQAFVGRVCGLVNESAPCRCERRVAFGLASGLIDPARLRLASRQNLTIVERYLDAHALYRAHPDAPVPETDVRALLDALVDA